MRQLFCINRIAAHQQHGFVVYIYHVFAEHLPIAHRACARDLPADKFKIFHRACHPWYLFLPAVLSENNAAQFKNASWITFTARSASSSAISTEILISLVEIMRMLMFASNSASNMRAATPEWLCIPAPTMLTLATLRSARISPHPKRLRFSSSTASAASTSASGTVKITSLQPSLPEDCKIISTLILRCAIRLNTLKDAPGTSGTSKIEITATSLSFATPLISIPSTSVTSFTMVPGTLVSDERTSKLTEYFFASSTLRLFSTCAPRLASSSISSNEISFSLRAQRTRRGSAVYTPSTSV